MEDALHCEVYGLVMCIDRVWLVCSAGWAKGLSGSQ